MPLPDKTLLVCPARNPGSGFEAWLLAYQAQDYKPDTALIVDSSSDDGSLVRAGDYGLILETIPQHTFSHGGTRQQAVNDHPDHDYVIFLTQDAILADGHALRNILAPFKDEKVGVRTGRRFPRPRYRGPVADRARRRSA